MNFLYYAVNGPEFGKNEIFQCVCWVFVYNICIFISVFLCRLRLDNMMKYIMLRCKKRKYWQKIINTIFISGILCTILIVVPYVIIYDRISKTIITLLTIFLGIFFASTIMEVIEKMCGIKIAYVVTAAGSIVTSVLWSMGERWVVILPWSYPMMGTYAGDTALLYRNIIIQIIVTAGIWLASEKIIEFNLEHNNGQGAV